MSTVDPTAEALGRGVSSDDSAGRLSSRLEEIRALLERQQRAGASLFSRMDHVLALAGAVVLPLGVAAIFLGWYGAARTPLLFEQIPYLISGGLLGVGLMIGGGMLFFGSWLARMAEQDRVASEELVDSIRDLRQAVLERPATPAVTAGAPAGAALVATPTGSMAHLPDCSVVARRDDAVPVTSAAGYRACKLCAPEIDETTTVTAASRGGETHA